MKLEEGRTARERAAALLREAGIAVTAGEVETMEIADFGLGRPGLYGFQIVGSEHDALAKEIVLFPRQTSPDAAPSPRGQADRELEETFRCRWGEVYLYTAGKQAAAPKAALPDQEKGNFTVWHERVLRPGDQFTLPPTASIGSRRASGGRS